MSISNLKKGSNFTYIEPVNIYDCEVMDNVFVGPFVEIQKDVESAAALEESGVPV